MSNYCAQKTLGVTAIYIRIYVLLIEPLRVKVYGLYEMIDKI